MHSLFQNLRYAGRQLVHNPGFSVAAVVTVALGIGVTTVVFSLTNALLLRPLPVHEPERLIAVVEVAESGDSRYSVSYPHFIEYREGGAEIVRLGASGYGELAFQAGDEARTLLGGYVTADYFELLGLAPARGRFFTAEEEVPGAAAPVAVLSHALWQRQFGGNPAVIGQTVRLNSQLLTIVGVAPEGFRGLQTGLAEDVWVPIPMYAVLNPGSDIYTPERHSWLTVFGRLNPGVEAPAAEAVLSAIGRGIAEGSQRGRVTAGVAVSRLSGMAADLRTPVALFLGLLLATAALVLLIACVNVAGMLLARATTRRREIGVRLALGAGRGRLVGQLLTETVLLFLLGGTGGVLIALWLTGVVTAFPGSLPGEMAMITLDAAPDARVIAFALVVALGTGLLCGLAPALRASRPDIIASLKEREGAAGGRSRLRSALVVGQISITLLLLAIAGLLVRSLQGALAIDPGINAEGVFVGSVNLEPHGYDETRGRTFFDRLTEQLGAQPGVHAVALARAIPLTFTQDVVSVVVPGHEPPSGRESFSIDYNTVDHRYFRTLEIPLQGRGFLAADGPDAPAVAVVNRTLATRFWPDGDAIGQRVSIGGEEVVIVGIAGDGKYHSLGEDPLPYLYLPFSQQYVDRMTLHVRADGGLGAVTAMMRRELRDLDPYVPLVAPGSLEGGIRISLLPHRIGAALIGAFGALGLLLAAVGLYGVLAYSVSQRTREIGVRVALGARTADVLRMVLREGGVLVGAGLAAGLALAFAGTRLLGSMLIDVSPTDPLTLAGVSLLLAAVALLASYLPARRAARVDPMIALRSE